MSCIVLLLWVAEVAVSAGNSFCHEATASAVARRCSQVLARLERDGSCTLVSVLNLYNQQEYLHCATVFVLLVCTAGIKLGVKGNGPILNL